VREAIRRALDDIAEQRMAEAYRQLPDSIEPPYVDAAAWEMSTTRRVRRRR
jgi:hypothetical protein